MSDPDREEIWFHGVAASPGIALAEVVVPEPVDVDVPERKIEPEQVEAEVARFEKAVHDAAEEIRAVRQTTAEMVGEDPASIFDAHITILTDPMAYDETIRGIREERKNAEYLFRRNLTRVAETLEAHDDPYFNERAQDIRDVKRRVLRRLANVSESPLTGSGPGILVAHEVSPSEAALLDESRVLGLAVDIGGRTSHAAIMARSRGIPAIVGLKNIGSEVEAGDFIILDGFQGRVILNPRPETRADYINRQARHHESERKCAALAGLPAITLDGHALTLAANVELPEEADFVLRKGAMGIGLFRTEFFLMRHHRFPAEEIQFRAYKSVARKMSPHPVIIRTLDVGGDKFASYLGTSAEDNPFLGMRGIRFLSDHKDLFHSQIRASYRASAFGRVKVLLPMVSGLEELRAARELCAQVQKELSREGVPFDPYMELGIMVEVPSTVILADVLAREADFFSIGSNDLIQYTLAVDRGSARVAHLYEPLHPAVLRSIQRTVEAAHAHKRWVGICGEMASDPAAAILLVGLGLDEISVGAYLLPEVKRIIRGIDYKEARAWAAQAAALSTTEEVRNLMKPIVDRLFPELSGAGNGGPDPRPGAPS